MDGEIISNIVTDFDGNAYNGIVVGNQIWMQENLHTSHYADGTPIPMSDEVSVEFAYCYYPDNDSANVTEYGYLYNWKAAMRDSESSNSVPSGVQGACPDGWHLPSDVEWVQLLDTTISGTTLLAGVPPSLVPTTLIPSIFITTIPASIVTEITNISVSPCVVCAISCRSY